MLKKQTLLLTNAVTEIVCKTCYKQENDTLGEIDSFDRFLVNKNQFTQLFCKRSTPDSLDTIRELLPLPYGNLDNLRSRVLKKGM